MPKVGGPGSDNISGDRYTLDLGVEPDLGNLLQNLQVANDLLEAVEEKFHSISDVVGSTTQRLSQATRQTQLLASETQRLQNSYSLMAQSSFTLANMGQMAGGMGMMPGMRMGMMPGMMPGQMAFGGMPPAAEVAETIGGEGGGGGREDIPEFEPPPPAGGGFPLSVRAASLEQLTQQTGRLFGQRASSPFGLAIAKMKYGFQMRRRGVVDREIKDNVLQAAAAKNAAATSTTEGEVAPKTAAVPSTEAAPVAAEAAPVAAEVPATEAGAGLTEAAAAGTFSGIAADAGALGVLGAGAGMVAPYAAAAYAGYKLWASQEAAARRLTGITGNTSLLGGVGGGSLAMKGQAIWGSLINPGVDYTRAQEEALGTGAVGQKYTETRDFLLEASKRGLSDTIDMVDLYSESIDKAGGTTQELTHAIDTMRNVAANTNSNLTAMMTNFKTNVETFVNMGVSGPAAIQAAQFQTVAPGVFSTAAMTSPVLRNGTPLNMTPYLQAQIAANNGMSYANLPIQAALNPAFGGSLPVKVENVQTKGLGTFGFTENMSRDQILETMKSSGMGQYLGPLFQQLGYINVPNPNDLSTVATAIQSEMQHPMAAAQRHAEEASKLQPLHKTYTSAGITLPESAQHHVKSVLGIAKAGPGDVQGQGQGQDVARQYESYIRETGKTSPVMDAIISGTGGGRDTYVKNKVSGRIMPLQDFLKANPQGETMLSDPKSDWEIGTASEAIQTAMAKGSHMVNGHRVLTAAGQTARGDIQFGTGAQIAGGNAVDETPNATGPSPNSTGTVDLGNHTIQRLADAIAHAEDH